MRGNLLNDPARRRVAVYLAGNPKAGAPCPLLVYLAPFTGSGLKKIGWRMFGESIPQRLDRLADEGRIGPVAVAFPDCFTSLGGNQYLNNPVFGNWEDFLLEELVPELERRFPVSRGPAGRGVLGFSSGGYGALIQGLRHGPRWGAVACHSGDMGFDNLFRADFPKLANRLAQANGDAEELCHRFWEAPKSQGEDLHTLLMLAMCAAYDPDPGRPLGIRLPFDPHTCVLDSKRWRRWLLHDPAEMVRTPEHQENLRALGLLYLDCGSFDQYHLQFGARRFVSTLREADVPHYYEEFEDNHSGVEYRLDVSIPMLYKKLASG